MSRRIHQHLIDNYITSVETDRRFTRKLIEASRWSSSEATGYLSSDDHLSKVVVWRINNFCELPKSEFFNTMSSLFDFEGQKWKLMLWPNYDPEHIELNLLRKGPAVCGHNGVVRFSFGLMRSDGTFKIIQSQEFSLELRSREWSCALTSQAILRTQLKEETEALLPFGHLALYCRLTVLRFPGVNAYTQVETADHGNAIMSIESITGRNIGLGGNTEDDEEEFPDTKVFGNLSRNLRDLYAAGKDCDVTIQVKNDTFLAHRIILRARAPVLAAMISDTTSETENGFICVEDCDPKAVAVFLLFVYCGSTENLTAENVMSVYYVARKYEVPDLMEECVRCMLSNLTVDSVCSVICVASRYDEKVLMEAGTDFFSRECERNFPNSSLGKIYRGKYARGYRTHC